MAISNSECIGKTVVTHWPEITRLAGAGLSAQAEPIQMELV